MINKFQGLIEVFPLFFGGIFIGAYLFGVIE